MTTTTTRPVPLQPKTYAINMTKSDDELFERIMGDTTAVSSFEDHENLLFAAGATEMSVSSAAAAAAAAAATAKTTSRLLDVDDPASYELYGDELDSWEPLLPTDTDNTAAVEVSSVFRFRSSGDDDGDGEIAAVPALHGCNATFFDDGINEDDTTNHHHNHLDQEESTHFHAKSDSLPPQHFTTTTGDDMSTTISLTDEDTEPLAYNNNSDDHEQHMMESVDEDPDFESALQDLLADNSNAAAAAAAADDDDDLFAAAAIKSSDHSTLAGDEDARGGGGGNDDDAATTTAPPLKLTKDQQDFVDGRKRTLEEVHQAHLRVQRNGISKRRKRFKKPPEQKVVGPDSDKMKTVQRIRVYLTETAANGSMPEHKSVLDKFEQVVAAAETKFASGQSKYSHLPGTILENLVDELGGDVFLRVYKESQSYKSSPDDKNKANSNNDSITAVAAEDKKMVVPTVIQAAVAYGVHMALLAKITATSQPSTVGESSSVPSLEEAARTVEGMEEYERAFLCRHVTTSEMIREHLFTTPAAAAAAEEKPS